jgi:DNA-binding TFAR19-related protein (PDSD5 family)
MVEVSEQEQNDNSNETRMRKQLAQAYRNAQIEQQKKSMVRQLMDDKAYERLTNIRASNREMYSQLVDMIISLAQAKRLNGKMTEAQFLSILGRVTERPETGIDFKRK